MMLSWLRRCFNKKGKNSAEWFVIVNDVRLAILKNPVPEDMFWTSLEIVPVTMPADLRLCEDDFWLSGLWGITDAGTNKPVPNVVASSVGIDRQTGRILLRGIHAL